MMMASQYGEHAGPVRIDLSEERGFAAAMGCSMGKWRTCANEMQPAHRTELKAAVGAALGDGGLYPARLAMGGGAGYGTALEALRDGSGRCTRRGA